MPDRTIRDRTLLSLHGCSGEEGMKNLQIATLAFVMCGAAAVQAQMGGGTAQGAPAVAPGSPVDPAKSLDATLSRVESLWMGAAKAMPADKYGFKPSAANFAAAQGVKFDGVRSFAEIATHTVQANYGAFSAIGGIK